ncbi:MAG: DUF2147 domain-containing protein [Deltaproteobacteria bacterium]|nr:MAG: DUF2147 domain-containing protein [Deltaproteobacteria bacterium]
MKTLLKTVGTVLFGLAVFGFTANASAGNLVEGYWKNIDDKDKKPKAVIHIFKKGKKFYGQIIKLFRKKPQELCPKCDKCKGFRKNRPTCGMVMLWDLKKEGENTYGHGKILDPKNGKEYGAKIWIDAKNKNKLNVRGYLFIFFRTQYWYRVSKPTKGTCKQVCGGKKAPAKKKG